MSDDRVEDLLLKAAARAAVGSENTGREQLARVLPEFTDGERHVLMVRLANNIRDIEPGVAALGPKLFSIIGYVMAIAREMGPLPEMEGPAYEAAKAELELMAEFFERIDGLIADVAAEDPERASVMVAIVSDLQTKATADVTRFVSVLGAALKDLGL